MRIEDIILMNDIANSNSSYILEDRDIFSTILKVRNLSLSSQEIDEMQKNMRVFYAINNKDIEKTKIFKTFRELVFFLIKEESLCLPVQNDYTREEIEEIADAVSIITNGLITLYDEPEESEYRYSVSYDTSDRSY